MKRSLLGWTFAFALALGGSAFAWVWFAGGSGEPSTELTTPTIAGSESATSTADTAEPTGTSEATTTTVASSSASFVIVAEQSMASFEIDEELRGAPQRVVGTTSQVAGRVQVDLSNLSTAQFSDILINARTFETDSGQRDRAIRGPVILNSASDEFELITFTATSTEGLSGVGAVGETIEFTVTGDLTVKGATNQETFDVSVTFADEGTIRGSATTTVLRSDYDIGIPSVPSVANVSDEVELTLDFVAVAGQG